MMKIINNNRKKCRFVHRVKIVKRIICIMLVFLLGLGFTGCNKANDNNTNQKLADVTTVAISPTVLASRDTTTEKITSSNQVEVTEAVPEIKDVNYSECFDGIKGCAIFFNSDANVYTMYNEELCEKRSSPNSTFKIISTLIGLENGDLNSLDSTMGYDGTIYTNEDWNKNLSLKDAFKESCVWYFRKVIDRIGQREIQKWLDKLEYGNCDISEWEGNGMNSLPALNGFWLESSLEISPKEQVDIITEIFEGKTDFAQKNIAILKEVMLVHKDGNVSVYGKTGTGKNADTGKIDNGWFVGMFEDNAERYYFAVHLTDEKSEDVWGPKAKEIALKIINKYYVEK